MAEKSVIASISQAEERPFKTPQLPALRAVVSESALQKRRFFLLLYFQLVGSPPIQGRKLCFNDRHRLSSHSADKDCKLPLAGHGASLSLFARHSPSHGQTGAAFPLSALRPAGRAKWVRASARIAGHPAAPSPTTSDRRSACPVQEAGNRLRKLSQKRQGGEASPPWRLALRIHLSSPQNLSRITAAWARVAVPWGLRVEPSPVPWMIPAPQAHWRAGMAYSAFPTYG